MPTPCLFCISSRIAYLKLLNFVTSDLLAAQYFALCALQAFVAAWRQPWISLM